MIKALKGLLILCLTAIIGICAVILRYAAMLPACIFIKDREKQLKACSDILRNSWNLFMKLLKISGLARVDFQDIEKIKNIKNTIIAASHPSLLDVVILISAIPYTTCFAAEKLERNIFFKSIVNLMFVHAGNIEKWAEKACFFLAAGFNIIIFPAGGRHAPGEHPKIHRGAAFLAQKSKKDIVMLKIKNDYDFLAKNKSVFRAPEKIVNYTISCAGKIDIKDIMRKYPDETDCRREITKLIKNNLYN